MAGIVLLVWMLLVFASSVFFSLNKNAALKRRIYPPFVIAAGFVPVGLLAFLRVPAEFVVGAGIVIAALGALTIRTVKFCDACGRTAHSQNPFAPPKFCSKCGAGIKA